MTAEEFNAHFNLQLGIFADKPAQEIPDSDRLREDLCMDDLDVVEFIMTLEDEFNIFIPEDDVRDLSTVGEYRDTARRLVEEQKGPFV